MLRDASCAWRGCAVGKGLGRPCLVSLRIAGPRPALTPRTIQGGRHFRPARKADI